MLRDTRWVSVFLCRELVICGTHWEWDVIHERPDGTVRETFCLSTGHWIVIENESYVSVDTSAVFTGARVRYYPGGYTCVSQTGEVIFLLSKRGVP